MTTTPSEAAVGRVAAALARLEQKSAALQRETARQLAELEQEMAALRAALPVAAAAETGASLDSRIPADVAGNPAAFSSAADDMPAISAEGHAGTTAISASSASGDGVYAESASGTGVHAESASGTGVFAASAEGDAVIALSTKKDGVIAVSTNRHGVVATSTSQDGVYATSFGAGDGVHAESFGSGSGVHAVAGGASPSSGPPAAVRAEGGAAHGVVGTSAHGYGGEFSGGLAPLHLEPSKTPGPPRSLPHRMGDLMVDANGALYLCTAAGTPGTWKQIA